MLRDILIFAAGAAMTALGVRLAATSPFWDLVIGVASVVMLLSAVHFAFDKFVRPRLKRQKNLDSLLVMAMTGALVAFGALGIYVFRGPQNQNPGAGTAGPTTAIAPEIALIPPDMRHEVKWDPEIGYMVVAAEEGKVKDRQWTTPVFVIKTLNNTAVQDATIRWQTEITDLLKLVKDSNNLVDYKVDTTGGNLTISGGPKPRVPFTYRDTDLKSSQDISIPFITSAGARAFVPSNIFSSAMLYTLALMPETAGARLKPFTFSVTVSWNLPTAGEQKFLVKANIVNAKAPNIEEPKLDALMSFEVAKVE
jgi:hypothetical protein